MLALRTKLNLVLAALISAFVLFLLVLEVESTRRSVREEIEAANRVASQLLQRVTWVYAREGSASLAAFLERLGRVRANDITLYDANDKLLYRSPPAQYKAGRDAPAWFADIVVPQLAPQTFPLEGGGGRLVLEANASRAVLDGWDDLLRVLALGLAAIIVLNALVFWVVGRALKPFPQIAKGLTRFGQGELSFRLPQLPGREARVIGDAFNQMAGAVQDKVAAERRATESEQRLQESRELAQIVDQRLEEERRLIAHELHDEFGQSVTAIRTLAVAIERQDAGRDAQVSEAAKLIADEAARLYDAMHGLIPRLSPLALDSLGLADTLNGLVTDWRRRYPTVAINLSQRYDAEPTGSIALAVYRVAQEALVNALRHAAPQQVSICVEADRQSVNVSVDDDGKGLPDDWRAPGHFGLRGLESRVKQLGGTFSIGGNTPRGTHLTARIPLGAAT